MNAKLLLTKLSHIWLFYDPMDCSLPGSSEHGIFQARIPKWVVISFPGNLLNPGIEPTSLMSPTLAARFFTIDATWETWEHAWEYGFWKFLGEGEPRWVLYHTHSSSHYGQSWDLLYSRNLGSQLKGITFLSCIFRFNIWQVPKEINKHSLQFGTERTLFSLLFL